MDWSERVLVISRFHGSDKKIRQSLWGLSIVIFLWVLPDFTTGTNEEEEVQYDVCASNDYNCEGSHDGVLCNIIQTPLEAL